MQYNHAAIGGNLTRDPELRYTPKGTAILSGTVANSRKWRDDQGNLQEEVSFVDFTAFGKTAENIGKYFKKGSTILVSGRIKQDRWDDRQTGQKRSKVLLIVDRFDFAGGNREEPQARQSHPPHQNQSHPQDEPQLPADDDVPF